MFLSPIAALIVCVYLAVARDRCLKQQGSRQTVTRATVAVGTAVGSVLLTLALIAVREFFPNPPIGMFLGWGTLFIDIAGSITAVVLVVRAQRMHKSEYPDSAVVPPLNGIHGLTYTWRAESFFGSKYELMSANTSILAVNAKDPEAVELSAPGIDLCTQFDIASFETGGAFVIKGTDRTSGSVVSRLLFDRPSWGTACKKDGSLGRIETQSGFTYTLHQENGAIVARGNGRMMAVRPGLVDIPKETTTNLNMREPETTAILLCLFALPLVVRSMRSGSG